MMTPELLTPYETVEDAAAALVQEAEAYLLHARRRRLLRVLGRTMLEGLALYGGVVSGCGVYQSE